MSSISYDGRSFSIDGRRIWLVSGAVHYFRTPHQLWRKRLRAAKEAGLNCIETYCAWNAHEKQPGQFDFGGDLDLRAFVQMVGEEGMYCIVRPGPYICAEWDFGGMPAWLHKQYADAGEQTLRLRQSHPIFLEATARYLTAIMGQIRDLQITGSGTPERNGATNKPGHTAGGYLGGGGGPIIMIQAENEWFCHNPEENEKYLTEVVRYLRENGAEVPINNCNNLWQRMDGTIDCWNGARNLPIDMRQLAVVQPEAPRLVTEYWPGWFDQWGKEHSRVDPDLHLYRMAGILATGSQFNLYMFHGGTNFGFYGGRTVADAGCYMTTSYDYDAPLLEAGGRGRKYELTKRLCTFASQFGHVFANLGDDPPHTTVTLNETDHPLGVVHLCGTQGDVVFLLRSEKDKTRETQLMLPNGLTLPVTIGDDRAAWLLLNVNLGGAGTLDYTNLRPWAFLDRKTLVLFGPAGSTGIVGVEGSHFAVKVPTGREPLVEQHDDLVLVVLSDEQVDSAYLFDGGIALHSAGLDDAGQPLPRDARGVFVIERDGKVRKRDTKPARRPTAPRLSGWQHASCDSFLDGSDDAFQAIDGPKSLEELGVDFGYGWYRVPTKATQGKVYAPQSGDRLHVYKGGKLLNILGFAPGAEQEPTSLRLGGDVVVLADNLGRFNYGQRTGEKKGLFGHLLAVKPVRLAKPKRLEERAADPFALTGYIYHRRKGDLPVTDSLVWTIKPSGKQPMVLVVDGLPVRGTWLINGEPVALYMGGNSANYDRWVFTPGEGPFKAGNNELKFSPLDPVDPKLDPNKFLKLYQATAAPSDKGEWAFCPWRVPGREAFAKPPATRSAKPAWFRCEFNVGAADVPLWLEPRGMTKGQLYLNGHDLGRYWMNTHKGKAVPPQRLYYLPEPWLKTDGPNELVLFDEHGADPSKCRLVYDPMGPYNG